MTPRSTTDGRAKRWDEHNARRRSAVLDTAVEVISENGTGVTVKQIAERLGIPRPVVYRYFDDRRHLDEQIRARILEMLVPQLADALQPEGTVGDTVQRAVGAYLAWIERHPNLHRFLGAGNPRERQSDSPVVTSARSVVAGQITGLLASALDKAGQPIDYARPMAFGLLGLADGAVNGWRSDNASKLNAEDLGSMLTGSILTLVQHTAATFDIDLKPDTPMQDLLG